MTPVQRPERDHILSLRPPHPIAQMALVQAALGRVLRK